MIFSIKMEKNSKLIPFAYMPMKEYLHCKENQIYQIFLLMKDDRVSREDEDDEKRVNMNL